MKTTKRGGFEMKSIGTAAAIWLALSLGLASPGLARWIEDGAPIAAYAGYQGTIRMVADGYGGAFISWEDTRNGGSDIYMQHVNKYGEELWTAGGIPVASGSSSQTGHSLCLVSQGIAVVAYYDNVGAVNNIYAQKVDKNGVLYWGTGGTPVATSLASYPNNVRIVAGSSDGAIVGWIDARAGSPDVYAQRLNSSGAPQWTANGVVICNAANDQGEMEMAADGSGGAIFVWEDARTAGILPIYGQKINSAGAVQWTANGIRMNNSDTWQLLPKLIATTSGGAILVWYEDRGADNNIYAQQVSSTGTKMWGTSGVWVCTATGGQWNPCLTTDGAGGAIFAWNDMRTSPPYSDIYAQRLNSAGTPEWTVNGVFVSDPAESQVDPVIVSDGVHGAIIAWKDQRLSNQYDIFAQRVDGDGAPQWLMQGEKVCGALGNQTLVQVVTDGDEGAFLAWVDYRTEANAEDVYAQRMDKHSYWGYPCPWLVSAVDVPHDEGGKVLLTWEPSYLDAFPEELITHYVIWMSTNSVTYVPIDSIDAYYLDMYQFAATTTADSGSGGMAQHYFKIRANTLMSNYWWESKVLSCHSVDNISPAPPAGLAAEQSFDPVGLRLSWTPGAEADIDHYAVYRGAGEDFQPGPENLVASPPEAACFDAAWRWDAGYRYKVAAVDVHGNESGYASLAPDGVTGGDAPKAPAASYLAQNFPNPFNPATRIEFGLAAPANVSLRVYDASGRLVRVLANGERDAGAYSFVWDGRNDSGKEAESGIYFYRLEAGSFAETKKMILVR